MVLLLIGIVLFVAWCLYRAIRPRKHDCSVYTPTTRSYSRDDDYSRPASTGFGLGFSDSYSGSSSSSSSYDSYSSSSSSYDSGSSGGGFDGGSSGGGGASSDF